ncbi:L-ascorbate metabolism protein UlaG (beta-lactamase superfamily) [Kushneria sinocarnis]|uniref:L-ascorbate metabolism protein UlaG (Beta-lactamase superfamily) n=1 Tax=Kushneria sinocarnis TaxID=595502 RepID=A0A420WSX6_9GAMM|nr:MBL fold metallo-hydrolase [Kushneria sinocarnis]RKQ95789.1 L-ascorbate metabolism protein UlaG (beta-lactamase superfamily) [Kushneria sinocarnis]
MSRLVCGWPPLWWLSLKGLAGRYRYRGPVSDHFDGERFHNVPPLPPRAPGAFRQWREERRQRPAWQWRDLAVGPTPPARSAPDELRVTLVNHATFLIQSGGLNVLTDPVWSKRVSPLSFAGPARFHPPGLTLEQLPPLDVIFVSHSHYDHCDLRSLRQLAHRHPQTLLVTGLGNETLMRELGFVNVVALDWWQTHTLAGSARLTFTPAQHWSARTRHDARRTLWGGLWLETRGAGALYFAGDSGFSAPLFTNLAERLGTPRCALLPIGAFRPEWFMAPVHMGPREAVEVHRLLGCEVSIACHFGCFALADEGQEEAQQTLAEARAKAGMAAAAFRVPCPGQPIVVEPPAVIGAGHDGVSDRNRV